MSLFKSKVGGCRDCPYRLRFVREDCRRVLSWDEREHVTEEFNRQITEFYNRNGHYPASITVNRDDLVDWVSILWRRYPDQLYFRYTSPDGKEVEIDVEDGHVPVEKKKPDFPVKIHLSGNLMADAEEVEVK